MIEKLTENNFLLYAAKHYDNPQCMDIDEFQDDLKRINYIKKLFNKYKTTGELKERLIINHLTVLYNCFGPEHTARMLLYKLKDFREYVKPFLVFMGCMPDKIYGVDDEIVLSSDILMDVNILDQLRKI